MTKEINDMAFVGGYELRIERETDKAVAVNVDTNYIGSHSRLVWIPKSQCKILEFALTEYEKRLGVTKVGGKIVTDVSEWFARKHGL